MFTDINIPFINENNDEDSVNLIILIEEFLESNNAIEIIKANMKDGLISELNNAIDKSIEYRTGIHVNPLNDALASLANTIERKIEDGVTKEELEKWIPLSNKDINKFFNTSGLIYKNENYKEKLKTMSYEEKIDALSQNPMLIKRPILVGNDFVLVGFKEIEYNTINR